MRGKKDIRPTLLSTSPHKKPRDAVIPVNLQKLCGFQVIFSVTDSILSVMFHPLTSMMQHGMSVVNPVNPISQNIMLPGFAPVGRLPYR